jgi:hypothetical protein
LARSLGSVLDRLRDERKAGNRDAANLLRDPMITAAKDWLVLNGYMLPDDRS